MNDVIDNMILVDQTILHDPPNTWGNCFNACLATLAQCSIEDTPQFITVDGVSTCDGDPWWTATQKWGIKRGFIVEYHLEDPSGVSIAGGPSPRHNDGHCVVWKDSKMIHDPHPSRDGIIEVRDFITLTKFSEIKYNG